MAEHQITSAGDLDLNIKRDDFGASNSTLSLIDFIGDTLKVDMDTLSTLDALFGGTTIDIDFAGGKDFDLGAILGISLPLGLGNDQVVLSGDGGTVANHDVKVHSSSDIVNDSSGLQFTVSDNDLDVISDSEVTLDQGSSVNAANITLKADAKSTGGIIGGLLADASSAVSLDNATLTATGGKVTLLASSDVTFTEHGDTYFSNGLSGTAVLSISSASVDLTGNATINAKDADIQAMINTDITADTDSGTATVKAVVVTVLDTPTVNISSADINLSGGNFLAKASSDLTVVASTVPVSGGSSSSDAAIAVSIVKSAPTLTMSGGSIDATGTAMLEADNTVDVHDIASGGSASSGATLGVTVLWGDTAATVSGGSITAAGVTVSSTSDRTATTESQATEGGADSGGGSNQSEERLADPNPNKANDGKSVEKAKTSDGDLPFAAAVSVGVVTGDTNAQVSGGTITSTGGNDIDVSASSTHDVSTTADGSHKTSNGGTAVGVAAAIQVVDSASLASIGGGADLTAAEIKVESEMPESTFESKATAGASGSGVGVAGALAINVSTLDANALVNSGSPDVNDSDVSLTATTNLTNTTKALGKQEGGGNVGVGAALALNIVNDTTIAGIADGANLLNADDLTLTATATDKVTTVAQAGSAGGTAVSPSVAITIANIETKTTIGTGSLLTLGGKLTMTATQDAIALTTAKADAAGTSTAAIGASLALGIVDDSVAASISRSVTASGDIDVKAVGTAASQAEASASAKGAKDKDTDTGEGKVNDKADNQLALGKDRATKDSNKGTDKTSTTDASTGDQDGGGSSKVQVAAAVAFNMFTTSSEALLVGAPVITSTSGKVKLRSSANSDARKTKADGTAVDASSVGIAAAVAINDVDITNRASTGTATVNARGLVVEATVTEREIAAPVIQLDVVNTTDESIFVGLDSGLSTGDKVKYDQNSGGTIGLTDGNDYWVNVGEDGTVKLYNDKDKAMAGGSDGLQNLTSAGSGPQKLKKGSDTVTFVAGGSVRVLNLGDDAALATGDAVRYEAGGSVIGGLSDHGNYYAIDLTDGHYQLASSRANALKGDAIPFTNDGNVNQKVIEKVHAVRSEADSGSASDKVSVAGALALNIVNNHTEALVPGGTVTLSGGGDVLINAVNAESDVANATSKAKGGSVGVGASIALNILPHSHTRAEISNGVSFSGTGLGTVTVTSDAMRTIVTEVKAGSAGEVSVTPAVALALDLDDTSVARIGSGTGSLSGSGALKVEAKHTADFLRTKADAAAAGSDAAIGAGLAIVITDGWSTTAELNRNATAGSLQVLATSSLTSAPEASASASGGDDSDSTADKKADEQTSNNSNTGGAPTTDTSKNNGSDANSQSSGQSGGGGSSVGIAASIAVDVVSVSNAASIGSNVTVAANSGAVQVSASTNVDAKARTDSTAVDLDGSANIAAAFSLNAVSITNTATVGAGADVSGNGITVEAITPVGDHNDISARALSVAGNKGGDVAIAGVFAINVVDSETKAQTGDGSHLHGGAGPVNITARHDLRIQALAASAGFSGSGAAIGAAVAINVIGTGTGGSHTTASIGDPNANGSAATVDGTGAVNVSAQHTIGTLDVELPKEVTDVIGDVSIPLTSLAAAAGGSAGSSKPGIAGSVDINIFDTTTQAFVDTNAQVGQGVSHNSTLTVSATDTTVIKSAAGSVGIGIGGTGIGAGLDLAIVRKNTRAYVGQNAQVTTNGLTSVTADSSENVLSISANVGIGTDGVGIAGSGSGRSSIPRRAPTSTAVRRSPILAASISTPAGRSP